VSDRTCGGVLREDTPNGPALASASIPTGGGGKAAPKFGTLVGEERRRGEEEKRRRGAPFRIVSRSTQLPVTKRRPRTQVTISLLPDVGVYHLVALPAF